MLRYIFTLIFVLLFTACGPELPDGFLDSPPPNRNEVIRYFLEIGLCPEFGECPIPMVKKWTSDIRIQLHGNYTESDEQELEIITSELSELTGLSVTIVNSNPNIDIYFVSQTLFQKYIPEYKNPAKQDGLFVSRNHPGNSVLYSATICIRQDANQHLRKHLLREELTQAIGIPADSRTYKNSIFQQDPFYQPTEYSAMDKEVIKLLYDKKMRPGMTKNEIEVVFSDSSQIASN